MIAPPPSFLPSNSQPDSFQPTFPFLSFQSSPDIRLFRRFPLGFFDQEHFCNHSFQARSLAEQSLQDSPVSNSFNSYSHYNSQSLAIHRVTQTLSSKRSRSIRKSSTAPIQPQRRVSRKLGTIMELPISSTETTAASQPAPEPPSSPPSLSSSASSSRSSPSTNPEEYDSSHFEDISLAEELPPYALPTKSLGQSSDSPTSACSPLRNNTFRRLNFSSSSDSAHARPTPSHHSSPRALRSSNSLSPREILHRGNSSPALAGSPTRYNFNSSRTRFQPPRGHPFPFAPASPCSPDRFTPTNQSNRLYENSPMPPASLLPRRGSWQHTKRKTAQELEDEYHDSDEELPEDAIVWNIPLTPRPRYSRSQSNSPSRGQGNNKKEDLPPQPQSGTLERRPRQKTPRSKSWTQALGDLSDEAKALTEALESHADLTRTQSSDWLVQYPSKHQHANKAALPPKQQGDPMIDPLPPSREKQKYLCRTRPSWLPPKCQKEEKKHLKEWEKMMADFIEAEKRKSLPSSETNSSAEELSEVTKT